MEGPPSQSLCLLFKWLSLFTQHMPNSQLKGGYWDQKQKAFQIPKGSPCDTRLFMADG